MKPALGPGWMRAAAVGGLLAMIAGAYFLGRRGAPLRAASPPAAAEGQGQEGEKHEGDEHGTEEVIRFSPEALRTANLKVEPVTTRPLDARLSVTGTVEPNLGGVVKVTPRVAGKIMDVRVNVGDNVRAGQALATLASTELAVAQSAYHHAIQQLGVARKNLQRQKQLAGLGEFGRHKLEEARGAEVAVQGDIETVQSEIAAAKNEVIEARSDQSAREGEVAAAEAAVASAGSAIVEAQGQVRAMEAALAQARTQVVVMKARFNRVERLMTAGLASRQQFEEADADYQRALADVDAARAGVSQAEARVEAARAGQQAAHENVRAARGRARQAAAAVDSAVARQAQVEAKLAAARKRGEIAAQARTREEKVFQGGYLSSKEIVEAEAAVSEAEHEQEAAENTIRLLGGRPGGSNTLTITAPLDGRVTERLVTLGETVTPEKTLFTVINLSTVWVQLAVYQKDQPLVRVGQAVSVTSDTAPGKVFHGTVSHLGDVVDETTRTIPVRAVIQNLENALKPKTFVRGTIATGVRTQGVAVPREAIQTFEGNQVVFVRGDHAGEFVARSVEAGETVRGLTAIRSGVAAGDQVVTEGAFMVKAQAMKSELGHEH